MKVFLLYHSCDVDGHSSAWQIYRAVRENFLNDLFGVDEAPEVVLQQYNYGWRVSKSKIDFKTDWVFMADMSLPEDEMLDFYQKLGKRFVWIDHHESIIRKTNDTPLKDAEGIRCLFPEDGEPLAATELTYFWLAENGVYSESDPRDERFFKLIRGFGAYDTFRARGEANWLGLLHQQYALKTIETNPNTEKGRAFWKSVFEEACSSEEAYRGFIEEMEDGVGKTVFNVFQSHYDSQLVYSFVGNIKDKKGVFCNRPPLAGSVGFMPRQKPEYDFCCDYVHDQKNGQWKFHFYVPEGKTETTNLIELLDGLPYGGHRGAGGMQVKDWRVDQQGFVEFECQD